MPDVFDTSPLLHRFIQPLLYNHLKGFESFDNATLAGTVITNKGQSGG